MSLDTLTMQAVTGIVITTVAVLFVLDTRGREASLLDRLWSLAFGAALLSSPAYLLAAAGPAWWWANAVGNGAVVLTLFAMWSGCRVWAGRTPRWPVAAGAAAVAVLAPVLQGPDAGAWAGGWALLGGTALGAFLAAGTLVRAAGRRATRQSVTRRPTALRLAAVLALAGLFYAARLVALLGAGADSEVFTTWFGTSVSSVVIIVLMTGAAFCMISLRGDDARRVAAEHRNYDPMTGARTVASFRPRALEIVAADRGAHRPVAMVTILLEDTGRIGTAFDRATADRALVVMGDTIGRLAPSHAMVGREEHVDGFDVLLSGSDAAAARAWAEHVRVELVAEPLDVGGVQLRLRLSAGVAADATAGYDLDDLAQVSRDTAAAAARSGGNLVHVAGPEQARESLRSVGRSPGAPRG